ncbi:MAG: carboxypeptidase-like regulatory domain-containing protein [Gemmatimonadales bacterium]
MRTYRRERVRATRAHGQARAALGLGFAVLAATAPLAAQGLSGAAVEGRVLGADSTVLEQAIVRVSNVSNGGRWETRTNARGRYFIENLSVGGPYRIEVRAIGFAPVAGQPGRGTGKPGGALPRG